MIKDLKNWFIFQYNSIWNYFHFRYMKRKAEKMHKITGKQYFVVPKTKKSCMVVDNSFIKAYNKSVPKGKRIKHVDLLKLCYYKTSSGTYKH